MSGRIIALFVVAATLGGWIIYRRATNQPLNPFDKQTLGSVQATPEGKNAATSAAESTKVQPYEYLGGSASLGQQLQSALDKYRKQRKLDNAEDSGTSGLIDSVRLNALPIAVGSAAAIGTAALQKLRSAKGAPAKLTPLVKTSAGVVKPAAGVKSPASLAKPVPKTLGTQPAALRKPVTVQVLKPTPVTKAVAITGKTATAAAIDSTKVLSGLKVAGRVAGRVVLPVAIGLSVYDAAERYQRKGDKFDVGDVVASASGLGGFGLRQYLPDWLKTAADTPLVKVPEQLAAAFPPQDAARRAAILAARSRYQTKYRSGG